MLIFRHIQMTKALKVPGIHGPKSEDSETELGTKTHTPLDNATF